MGAAQIAAFCYVLTKKVTPTCVSHRSPQGQRRFARLNDRERYEPELR